MVTKNFAYLARKAHGASEMIDFECELFVSAFNNSQRVSAVFENVAAGRKVWVFHSEYSVHDAPTDAFVAGGCSEIQFWMEFEAWLGTSLGDVGKICVDITGMMRPHILTLLSVMKARGVRDSVFVYGDPIVYASGHRTTFSKGPVQIVRQVEGFEGLHTQVTHAKDSLIIGTGYDVDLVTRVAESKGSADKIQLFGLPSLQPHMYRENRVQAARAVESLGRQSSTSHLFAPANDPFATATVLRDFVRLRGKSVDNLYLAPLGTKPQTLGFGLYYLADCVNTATSVLFPFRSGYEAETSAGLARVWSYEVPIHWL